jgi:hypothetical protein
MKRRRIYVKVKVTHFMCYISMIYVAKRLVVRVAQRVEQQCKDNAGSNPPVRRKDWSFRWDRINKDSVLNAVSLNYSLKRAFVIYTILVMDFMICLNAKIDWLINCLLFYVPLKNISLVWRRHHYRWRAAKFRPVLGAQGLWAGSDLYRATPAMTRGLGFSGLIWRFSRFLRHTRGCGGSIWPGS